MEAPKEKVKNQCSEQCKQDMSQKRKMQMVAFDPILCATDYQGYNDGSPWKTDRLLQFMSN